MIWRSGPIPMRILSRRQRNVLTVVVEHIFYLHRSRRDAQNFVVAIDHFSFSCDKYSSPSERKTFLASPGLLANPKNFRLIGGGGGGGGGPVSAAFCSSVLTGAIGFGISAEPGRYPSRAFVLGIFTGPQPVERKVGSSERGAVLTFFPWPLTRVAGRGWAGD